MLRSIVEVRRRPKSPSSVLEGRIGGALLIQSRVDHRRRIHPHSLLLSTRLSSDSLRSEEGRKRMGRMTVKLQSVWKAWLPVNFGGMKDGH